MKTIRLLISAILVISLTSICYAEGNIWDRIKDHSVKVAVAYNIDNHKGEGALGGAIEKDFFGYKGIDIDAFMTTDISEAFSSDEKNLLTGISYNHYFGKDKSWSAFLGAGVMANDIINNIDELKDIEIDNVLPYFGIGKKFN